MAAVRQNRDMDVLQFIYFSAGMLVFFLSKIWFKNIGLILLFQPADWLFSGKSEA